MRIAICLAILTPLLSSQTTLDLKFPNGVNQTATLKPHPRLWWDSDQHAAFADPDGTGPAKNAALSTNTGQAIVDRTKAVRSSGRLISGERAQAGALWWWMDRNAKFDDGASVLAWVKDAMLNEFNRRPGYLVCDPSLGCGASSLAFDYGADWLVAWAHAYSLLHSEFTPAERSRLEKIFLNGLQEGCTSRLMGRQAGTLTVNKNSASITGDGTAFSSDLTGKTIFVRSSHPSTAYASWAVVSAVNGPDSLTVEWYPGASATGSGFWWWAVPDFTDNACGIAYMPSTHGNTPGRISRKDASGRLSSAISAYQGDPQAIPPPGGYEETISINKADWNPFGFYPFFARLTSSYVGTTSETVLVKSASGNTITVQRGLWSRTTNHAQDAAVIAFTHNPAATSEWALNNRSLARVSGYVNLGLAFADESQRAKDLAKFAIGHFRDSQGLGDLKDYFTILNHSAVNYGSLGRTNVHLGALALTLKNSMTPSWDFTGDWMRKGMGLFHLYWSTSWDPGLFLRYGIEAGGCGASMGVYWAPACFVTGAYMLNFYPDDPYTSYLWYHYKNRCAKCTEKLSAAAMASDGGENFLKPVMLFGRGDNPPKADYTGVLPTGYVDTHGDNGPPRGLGSFVSKQSWSTNASQIWGLYPQQYGDKDESGNGFSTYSIGKRGWLINHSVNRTPAYYWIDQQVVDFGPGYKGKSMPMYTANQKLDRSKVRDDLLYVRADLKETINPYHQPIHHLRHTVHLKQPGKDDFFVVFDDVAKANAERVRSLVHYPNNGEMSEGASRLSDDGTVMESSNGSAKIISKFLLGLRGGDAKIYDLSVSRSGNTLTVGKDCTSENPCRVKTVGQTFSFAAPATFSATGSGKAWLYVAGNGTLAAAYESGLQPNCSGMACSEGGDFPSDAVVRLVPVVITNGTLTSPSGTQCPGSFVRSSAQPPVEWGTCAGSDSRVAYLDAGTTDRAEFLVVHRATEDLGEQSRPTALLSEVDPEFDNRFAGVQVGGNDPAAVLFARGGEPVSSVSKLTVNFGSTGRILVAGLTAGQYNVTKLSDSSSVYSGLVESDGSLLFSADAGSYTVQYAGKPPLKVGSISPLPSAIAGEQYSFQLAAEGGETPYHWAVSSGNLPAGLTLTTSGLLEGTPTTQGEGLFEIEVTDSSDPLQADRRTFTLVVRPADAARILTQDLPDAWTSTPYSIQVAATGGVPPYQWSISSGGLPSGLEIDSSSGVISGTPLQSGVFSLVIQLRDNSAGSTAVERAYTLRVNAMVSELRVLTDTLPTAVKGRYFEHPLEATGGMPPYEWFADELKPLPEGLSVDVQGLIHGTPAVAGQWSVGVWVADRSDPTVWAAKELMLEVLEEGGEPLDLRMRRVGSQAVEFALGARDLDANVPCSLTIAAASSPDEIIESSTDLGGPSRRRFQLGMGCLLTPSTNFVVRGSCGTRTTTTSFTTASARSSEPAELAVKLKPPAGLGVSQVRLAYGAAKSLTQETTQDCAGGCTVKITYDRTKPLYLRRAFLNSGGQVVAESATGLAALP